MSLKILKGINCYYYFQFVILIIWVVSLWHAPARDGRTHCSLRDNELNWCHWIPTRLIERSNCWCAYLSWINATCTSHYQKTNAFVVLLSTCPFMTPTIDNFRLLPPFWINNSLRVLDNACYSRHNFYIIW